MPPFFAEKTMPTILQYYLLSGPFLHPSSRRKVRCAWGQGWVLLRHYYLLFLPLLFLRRFCNILYTALLPTKLSPPPLTLLPVLFSGCCFKIIIIVSSLSQHFETGWSQSRLRRTAVSSTPLTCIHRACW